MVERATPITNVSEIPRIRLISIDWKSILIGKRSNSVASYTNVLISCNSKAYSLNFFFCSYSDLFTSALISRNYNLLYSCGRVPTGLRFNIKHHKTFDSWGYFIGYELNVK
jgi:hypothetical protein